MKTEQKSKAPHIEKINTHVSPGQCVHSTFPHEDICDLLRMYCGKDCKQKLIQQTEDEVKRLYATFPQQLMTDFTQAIKREHDAAEKCHICLKILRIKR